MVPVSDKFNTTRMSHALKSGMKHVHTRMHEDACTRVATLVSFA